MYCSQGAGKCKEGQAQILAEKDKVNRFFCVVPARSLRPLAPTQDLYADLKATHVHTRPAILDSGSHRQIPVGLGWPPPGSDVQIGVQAPAGLIIHPRKGAEWRRAQVDGEDNGGHSGPIAYGNYHTKVQYKYPMIQMWVLEVQGRKDAACLGVARGQEGLGPWLVGAKHGSRTAGETRNWAVTSTYSREGDGTNEARRRRWSLVVAATVENTAQPPVDGRREDDAVAASVPAARVGGKAVAVANVEHVSVSQSAARAGSRLVLASSTAKRDDVV